MRIGVYAGRHQRGDAAWVYARSFLLALLDSAQGETSTEVVLYVHEVTLDRRLQEGIELSPILVTFATNYFYNGASRYFRKLPNGAQCRMLVRFLPAYLPFSVETLFLSALVWRDKIDVLQIVGEAIIPRVLCPVVVSTSPDQTFIPSSDCKDSEMSPRSLGRRHRSLGRANHVFAISEYERMAIIKSVGLNAVNVTVSRPALDDAFIMAQRRSMENRAELLLDEKRVKPGFLLISCPPKNSMVLSFLKELVSQLTVPAASIPRERLSNETIPIVILCDDDAQAKKIRKTVPDIPLVVIPRRIHRAVIISSARLVLLLHQGNECLRSALEAVALRKPFLCETGVMRLLAVSSDPVTDLAVELKSIDNVEQVADAVRNAWLNESSKWVGATERSDVKAQEGGAIRNFQQVVQEALAAYQRLCMQQGKLRQFR